jgi:hypothetical protein
MAPVGLALLTAAAHAADESRRVVAEAFASKPTAPIAIGWELSGEPRVGAPLTVSLTISADIELAGATLTLGVDDPLSLIEPATATPLGTLVPGTPVAIDVTVLPLTDVTHYLRVAVGGESSGQPQMRSVSIAIRFDNAAASKDAPGVASPAEAVHSLPAVETVR